VNGKKHALNPPQGIVGHSNQGITDWRRFSSDNNNVPNGGNCRRLYAIFISQSIKEKEI